MKKYLWVILIMFIPLLSFSQTTIKSTSEPTTYYKGGYPIDVARAYGSGGISLKALTDAIDQLNGSPAALLLSRGTWTISSDLSIPSNITLIVPPGTDISVSSGKKLTINGKIDAGLYQIFSGTGTFAFGSGLALKSSWFSSFEDAIIKIGAAGITLETTAPHAITTDCTVPGTMSLMIKKGNILTVAPGKTLTIKCPFEAGLYQIFGGPSSVSFTGGMVDQVHPEWWGLSGDGSADDTSALSSAYAAAGTCGAKLVLPAKTMKTTSMLIWNKDVDVQGTSRTTTVIKKYGDFIGIRIGDTTGTFGQSTYENFTLDSGGRADTRAGIEVWLGHRITMNNIKVAHQGSHGIVVRGSNMSTFQNIMTYMNGGDGFRIEGNTGHAGHAANANTIINLDTLSNKGNGFSIIQKTAGYSTSNFGLGIVSQQNGGVGILVGDLTNTLQVYCESNTGYDIQFDRTSIRNFITVNHLGPYASKYRDDGSNNVIIDASQGLYLRIPSVGAPVQSGNAAGKNFIVSGGAASAGPSAHPGGNVLLYGGDAAGIKGVATGGHVGISGGAGVNGGGHGHVHIQRYGGGLAVGSANAPGPSVAISMDSATRVLLLNRLTKTQRDALMPVNGMIIYNSTTNKFQGYQNGSWQDLIKQ
jgi:hypothetical protein